MASSSFEDLRVYRHSEELSDLIWDIVQTWNLLARDTVGKQAIRSADSVGANVAEGYGKGSYQDNRRFIRMARGLLYETRHWLRRAYKRNLLSDEQTARFRALIANLAPPAKLLFEIDWSRQINGRRLLT